MSEPSPSNAAPQPPRVFVSYSHDSPAHAERVLALADRLRRDGVDARLDQYEPHPAAGWPRWMIGQIEAADFVLLVATATYRRRFDGREERGRGKGVTWEGAILTEELYDAQGHNERFVPVVFAPGEADRVPTVLKSATFYDLADPAGYERLYRRLTAQPATPAPPLGSLRALSPEPRRQTFGLVPPAATPEPEETRLIAEYRRWSGERHARLDLVGLGAGDVRLRLDEVYVPLRFEHRPERRELEGLEGVGGLFEGAAGGGRVELDRLFLAGEGRHRLIFGEPGTGKTTALKKFHQLCLDAGPEALGLVPGTLPVFLRLRRLEPELLDASLFDFVAREVEEVAGGRLPEKAVDELKDRGRLLLLCDGLDEIADEAHRARVLRHLAWQLGEGGMGDVRAVVSCRNTGWTEKVREVDLGDAFERLEVRPLDDGQIARLVELWFREASVLGHLSPADAGDAAARLAEVLGSAGYASQQIKVLVSTPLLLTLLCVVVLRGGEIPRRRVEFYEQCLQVLLGRWRRQAGREPPVAVERAMAALGALAWRLHSEHRREDLTPPQAVAALKRSLGGDRKLGFRVFDWFVDDAGVLARYTESGYGFAHLGLQEYLAARHLGEHEKLFEGIAAEYDDAWWAEVFQLLAGLPGRRGFAALVRRLLATDAPFERADLLAACLAEAPDPDIEPFLEVLRGDDDARRLAVLRLLRGRRDDELLQLAEELAAQGPPALRATARQVLEQCREDAEPRRDCDLALLHRPEDVRPARRLAAALRKRACRVYLPAAGRRWQEPGELEAIVERCRAVAVVAGSEVEGWGDLADLWELCDEDVGWLVVCLPGGPAAVPGALAGVRRVELGEIDRPDELVDLVLEAAVEAAAAFAVVVGEEAEDRLVPDRPLREAITGELFLPVPAGRFEMGAEISSREQPIHWVRLSEFWLARTPVTNRQYALFLEATGHEEPSTWRDRRFSAPEQPVVTVSWEDAIAYCRWLAEASGLPVTLPSEAQWEYAARGTDGREYPWGKELPDERRACFDLDLRKGKPAEVGSFPDGAGPFEHLDLAGSVWEWCLDSWTDDYGQWRGSEPVDPLATGEAEFRPLRGGSWLDPAQLLRSAFRSRLRPWFRSVSIGFRVSLAPASLGSLKD